LHLLSAAATGFQFGYRTLRPRHSHFLSAAATGFQRCRLLFPSFPNSKHVSSVDIQSLVESVTPSLRGDSPFEMIRRLDTSTHFLSAAATGFQSTPKMTTTLFCYSHELLVESVTPSLRENSPIIQFQRRDRLSSKTNNIRLTFYPSAMPKARTPPIRSCSMLPFREHP
jgi:hypothetical protein